MKLSEEERRKRLRERKCEQMRKRYEKYRNELKQKMIEENQIEKQGEKYE